MYQHEGSEADGVAIGCFALNRWFPHRGCVPKYASN